MTLDRAIDHVDGVDGRTIRGHERAGMAGAVRHMLINAALSGVRFDTPEDVEAGWPAHTGLQALEVTRR